MKVFRIDPDETPLNILETVTEKILSGSVVAHPTETVYGLAANIYDRGAVERIYTVKGRRTSKPLSVMVANIDQVLKIVGSLSPFALNAFNKLLPGPITLIVPFNTVERLPYFEDRDTIGFRMPKHKFCNELLAMTNVPLTTTSANKSGLKSSELAVEVLAQFSQEVDILVDGGKTENGLSSTVIDLSDDKISILRNGAVSLEEIERTLGG